MCGGDHKCKRFIVWFAALVVMVFACVDLTDCHGRGYCFFMNIAILILSLFGVLGAYRNDGKLLGWFLLLVVAFIGFEVGFVIWAFVKNKGVRTVLWNLVLIGCLFVLGVLTADLRRHADGDHYGVLPN